MPEPFNYMLQNVPRPDFAGAFEKAQVAKVAEEKRLAQEEQARQMQMDLGELSRNPSVSSITTIMAKYPQMGEKFKPLLESASEQQKQNRIGQASDVYASVLAGRTDIAKNLLQEQADAARNSGNEQGAKSAEVMSQLLDNGDLGRNTVLSTVGMFLSQAMGADKFADTYTKLGGELRDAEQGTSKLRQAEAEADKAAVAAKYAESEAAMDLQKKGWDITAIQQDIEIKKQNVRIAAMNAAVAREGNDLKRQELGLKVQDAILARDDKVREKADAAAGAKATVDQSLGLIDELFADPDSLKAATGAGAWRASLPASSARTARGKIEQLQNTLALGNIDKLKGAMSDKDVMFLKNIAANLDRYQSEDQFAKELGKVKTILNDARSRIAKKYGMPDSQREVSVDY